MAKTLHTRTAEGWTTKGSALTAEEVDDNFLELEDAQGDTGDLSLEAKSSPVRAGWTNEIDKTLYPNTYSDVESGVPSIVADSGADISMQTDYNSDGSWLAVATTGPDRLEVFNTADWTDAHTISTFPSGGALDCKFSPDDAYLAVGTNGGDFLYVYDTSDWSLVSGTPVLAGNCNGVAWSPDGTRLACAHVNSPYVTVLDTADWSTVSGPSVPQEGRSVDYSNDGAYLAVAYHGVDNFNIYSTSDWTSQISVSVNGFGRDVRFSPNDTYLAVGHASSPYMTLIDVATMTVAENTAIADDIVWGADFDADENYLLFVGSGTSQFFYVVEIATYSLLSGTAVVGEQGRGIRYHHGTGKIAIAHDQPDQLTVVNEGGITSPSSVLEYRMKL